MKIKLLLLVISIGIVPVVFGNIQIASIGTPGINQTHPEFTALRTVLLNLNFTQNAIKCRYINYDQFVVPANNNLDWTFWESCVSSRLWELTPGAGLKRVYFQVNYSSVITTYNDSIYYNATGAGLDVTPPSTVTIFDGEYTNDNTSASITWTPAIDIESSLLGLPLLYEVSLFTIDAPTLLELPFDMASTNNYTYDISSYNDIGIVNGAQWNATSGIIKGGYNFDGTDDFIEVADDARFENLNEITISVWVYPHEPFLYARGLVNKFRDFEIGAAWNGGADSRVYINDVAYDFEPSIPPINVWTHLALTYDDAGVIYYYVNAQQYGPGSGTGNPITDNNRNILIGTTGNKNYFFNGTIDNLIIFNRSLTANEIQQLYQSKTLSIATLHTPNTSAEFPNNNFAHGTLILTKIITSNAAGLVSSSKSDGVIVDTQAPQLLNLKGETKNLSNGLLMNIPAPWVHANSLNFSWQLIDDTAGMKGVSYVLSSNPNALVDDIPDGPINALANVTHTLFSGINSGTYYFRIKPIDNANNNGNIQTMVAKIDNTPPTYPVIVNEQLSSGYYEVFWDAALDLQSTVIMYQINLTNEADIVIQSMQVSSSTRNVTFTLGGANNVKAVVGALNDVGLWSWSTSQQTIIDTTPPQLFTPPQSIYRAQPRLIFKTSEPAICSYQDSNWYQMQYTGSTLHEQPLSQTTGTKNYPLKCVDAAENVAFGSIDISVQQINPDELSITTNPNCIAGTHMNAALNYSYTSQPMSGIGKSEILMTFNGQEMPFSMYDMGNGIINISITCPDAGGVLSISSLGQGPIPIVLLVQPISLTVSYDAATITSWDQQSNLAKSDQQGIAATSPIVWSNSVGQLKANNIDIEAAVYLFSSKPFDAVQVNKEIAAGTFSPSSNDAFSYQLSNLYTQFILQSTLYDIKTRAQSPLYEGSYNYYIEKAFTSQGKPIVYLDP